MARRIEEVLERPTRTLDAWMAVEVPFDGQQKPWTVHLVGWRVESRTGVSGTAPDRVRQQLAALTEQVRVVRAALP